MRPLPTVLLCGPLLCLGACVRFTRSTTQPRIQPPSGTGQVQTSFLGGWTVVEIQNATNGPGVGGRIPLPGLGGVVTFDEQGFLSSGGQDMRREEIQVPATSQITDYLNQSDGRVALYVLKIEPKPVVGGEQFDQVQLAFGTEDENHLLGLVYFHQAPVGGNGPRQGAFLVRLQRR